MTDNRRTTESRHALVSIITSQCDDEQQKYCSFRSHLSISPSDLSHQHYTTIDF